MKKNNAHKHKKAYQIGLTNFVDNTVFLWDLTGKNYHAGHVNILRYAFFTSCYWGTFKGKDASKLKQYAKKHIF